MGQKCVAVSTTFDAVRSVRWWIVVWGVAPGLRPLTSTEPYFTRPREMPCPALCSRLLSSLSLLCLLMPNHQPHSTHHASLRTRTCGHLSAPLRALLPLPLRPFGACVNAVLQQACFPLSSVAGTTAATPGRRVAGWGAESGGHKCVQPRVARTQAGRRAPARQGCSLRRVHSPCLQGLREMTVERVDEVLMGR